MERLAWDEYFMSYAQLASTRSTCVRRQIGAVLVKDNFIISTGYNGSPTGQEHCIDKGCVRDKLHIESGIRTEMCMAVHAEANCIIQAANKGRSIVGATLYTTAFPCSYCARMLANSGIVAIWYLGDYPDALAKNIIECADMLVVRYADKYADEPLRNAIGHIRLAR